MRQHTGSRHLALQFTANNNHPETTDLHHGLVRERPGFFLLERPAGSTSPGPRVDQVVKQAGKKENAMHDCPSSRTARLCGVIFTGLMLIGLLVPHAFASPGDDPLADRIEAREAGGQATVEGRSNDRFGDLSRRDARDRSSLRGGQEGDSILDDPEMMRFFDKMPPEIFAIYGSPEFAGAVSDSVESIGRPRPAPEYLFSEITSAELNGMPVVEFQITDEFGLGIEGLSQGANVEFSFTVNKLVPGTNGELDSWSTYMVADDEGMENISAGAYVDGTLEDLGGGNYTFTFNDVLEAISGVR